MKSMSFLIRLLRGLSVWQHEIDLVKKTVKYLELKKLGKLKKEQLL